MTNISNDKIFPKFQVSESVYSVIAYLELRE